MRFNASPTVSVQRIGANSKVRWGAAERVRWRRIRDFGTALVLVLLVALLAASVIPMLLFVVVAVVTLTIAGLSLTGAMATRLAFGHVSVGPKNVLPSLRKDPYRAARRDAPADYPLFRSKVERRTIVSLHHERDDPAPDDDRPFTLQCRTATGESYVLAVRLTETDADVLAKELRAIVQVPALPARLHDGPTPVPDEVVKYRKGRVIMRREGGTPRAQD